MMSPGQWSKTLDDDDDDAYEAYSVSSVIIPQNVYNTQRHRAEGEVEYSAGALEVSEAA